MELQNDATLSYLSASLCSIHSKNLAIICFKEQELLILSVGQHQQCSVPTSSTVLMPSLQSGITELCCK